MSFGVIVRNRTLPSSRGPVTDSGRLFLAGTASAGPLTGPPTECRSVDDWTAVYGARTGVGVPSYDYLDAFFSEGGSSAMFARYAADYGDAFALFDDPRQGPGQLGVAGAGNLPGATLYSDMKTLSIATNKVALRDVGEADAITGMEADGDLAPANDDYGATFGPWVVVPPPAGVAGVGIRQVPASAIIAALCNRVDNDGNPNRAAAGPDYPLQFATGFVADVDDASRDLLFTHGVNAFADLYDVFQNYGFQTNIVDDVGNPYWQFNASRGRMFLTARCQARAQKYMFRLIDGRGKAEGQLKGDITAECKALYDVDGLYGDTPADAYAVSTSSSINTVDTIAQGELHGLAEVVWAMHTRSVIVDLVTVPIGNQVSVS